jgi:hypothetical protein
VHHVGLVDARVHHSMVALPRGDSCELVMFGGLTRADELTDATYRLEQVKGAWTFRDLQLPLHPSPRYHAAMVATPAGVFLYGGTTNGADGLPDFWCLSAEGWRQVEAEGDAPPPGFAFNLAFFQPDTLLLTGGVEGVFVFFKYSLDNNRWTQVTSRQSFMLPPYIGHQVFPIGDGVGLIVNGHTIHGACNDAVIQFVDWGAGDFVLIESRGMAPVGRVWGSAGMIGNYILVIGGEREAEMYAFDLRDTSWHFCNSVAAEQPMLFGAACAVFQNRIYIHGGFDDTASVQSTLHEGSLEKSSTVTDFVASFTDDIWKKETIAQVRFDEPEPWIEVQESS